MKLIPLPLVALALLLGACSSSTPTAANHVAPPPGPPVRGSTKVTAWGELPSYDARGHYFKDMRAPNGGPYNGKVTLDLLVNANGTVEDVAVFESSGNAQFDRAAADQFKKAQYTLQLGPDDPAPYVVRYTIVNRINDTGSQIPANMTNYSQLGPGPK
jgi:TonB family protein